MTQLFSIDVGPHKYKIVEGQVKDPQNMAEVDHETLTITVKPGLAPSMLRAAAVHEALHCMCYLSERFSDRKEEKIVRMLEAPLLKFIQDNPEFVGWLIDGQPVTVVATAHDWIQ